MEIKHTNRREFLKISAALSAIAVSSAIFPRGIFAADGSASTDDVLASFRKMMGAIPIEKTKLSDNLTLLSGPGGNVVVSDGKDGKFMIDTFVQPAWLNLKKALDEISANPITQVIDTHWHFDHTDNNASLRALGAKVLAHEKVPRRMSETHGIAALKIQIPPAPKEALPTETFSGKRLIEANGEKLHLEYVRPAHTDTDIFIHFPSSNVLHCGDLVTNHGGYPLIDYDTGGKIQGMIAASTHFLSLVDSKTRVIPGHGPITDRAYLVQFRDRLATIRDRVAALKGKRKSLEETIAAKPLSELNAVWGAGMINSDQYTEIVYRSL